MECLQYITISLFFYIRIVQVTGIRWNPPGQYAITAISEVRMQIVHVHNYMMLTQTACMQFLSVTTYNSYHVRIVISQY